MAELYQGPKFRTVFSGRQTTTHPWLTELIASARRFGARGWAEGNNGYLAVRSGNGMMIKTAGASLATLGPGQVAEVIDYDPVEHQVLAVGPSEPSSESAMAWMILRHRPDVHAIAHIHAPPPPDQDDTEQLRAAGITATTEEVDYGTLELATSCLGALRQTPVAWLRDHGYVAIGPTIVDAERRLLDAVANLHPDDPTLQPANTLHVEPATEAWTRHVQVDA